MPLYSLDGQAPELPASGNVWIAPDAVVLGRVRLGEGASVWFGAVLRGDNEWIEIGAGSNVQERVVCHTDLGAPLTVGRDCTIGHGAILHGCTLEDECLVGMGATVLNHAHLGRNCLVGAAALVTEGKRFEARSLVVGSPAKAVRSLDEAAVDALRRSAAGYRANALRFAAGLRRLD